VKSKAINIFKRLCEVEDEYGKVQDVVFIQGEEAEEPLKILDDEGVEAAADYLAQWDNGEGEFIDFPAGSDDDVEEIGEYIVVWNDRLSYIGIVKKISPELQKRYGV
jgi:hypothetical protein